MSFKYYKGQVVKVRDNRDPNFEREGPIVRQDDANDRAEVHFEDHTKEYKDFQIERVPDQPQWSQEQLDKLPDVERRMIKP